MSGEYRRPVYEAILERAHEPRQFIQVLAGPRQVGKTTLARQVMAAIGIPGHFASADAPDPEDIGWLYTQWQIGRQAARSGGRAGGLLVLDEIQKIRDWSDVVKELWDEDTAAGLPLRVMLLGSAPLLVRQGLSDSLAGRFEVIRVTHWTFAEMRDAFGWDLDTYLYYGGYPGAARLIRSQDRWEEYILDSIVETNLSRDILLLNRIEKPALLRQLFRLACSYSGQVLSYTKMLGSLTDAGNTVTLAHYLELLGGAGMVTGIGKYSGSAVRRRASPPKLLALNTALISATARTTFARTRADHAAWSRLVQTAVGAHLWAHADSDELAYWREGNNEVDWVLRPGRLLRGREEPVAIEVRTGHPRGSRGAVAFTHAHRGARSVVIGEGGIGIEQFLAAHPREWLDA
ncbi:MAG TPA: ATP-binding protein [candidate division Zixibacteria bacterium]|nr:ATP-binding protein [candidate division Zixibacteria bacterium]